MITVTYLGGARFETLAAGTDFSVALPGGLTAPSLTQVDVLVAVVLGRLSLWAVTGWTPEYDDAFGGTVATVAYDGIMTTADVHRVSANTSEHPAPPHAVEGVSVRVAAYRITMAPGTDVVATRAFTWSVSASRPVGSADSDTGDTTISVLTELVEPTIPPDTVVGDLTTSHYGFVIVSFGAWPDTRGQDDGGTVSPYDDGVPGSAPTWTDPVPIDTGLDLAPLGLTDGQWGMPLYDSLDGGIDQSPMRLHHTSDVTFPVPQGYDSTDTVCGTQYGVTILAAFLAIVETSEVRPLPECPDHLPAVATGGAVRVRAQPALVLRLPAGAALRAAALPEDGCPPQPAAAAGTVALRLRPHEPKD